MSYRCESCKKAVESGVLCNKVTIKKKMFNHPFRKGVYIKFDEETERFYKADDPGGRGWQIAKEIRMCPSCAKEFEEENLQESS